MGWVTDCAKCTAEEIFSDLVKLVEQDVKEREKLNKDEQPDPRESLPEFFYTDWSDDRLTMYVKYGRPSGNADTLCTISCEDDHIAIEVPATPPGVNYEAEIRPSWNLEYAECEFSISGREAPFRRDDLGRIVQGFLKPVFFPDRRA